MSRNRRTKSPRSTPNEKSRDQSGAGSNMSSHNETVSVAEATSSVEASNLGQRLMTLSFFGACAIGMLGWLIGLAWATLSLARWMFF